MADRPQTVAGVGARYAVYVAGISSLGLVPMASVVVPLWAIEIGTPPVLMGLALGARSLLLVFFSIHGGALIGRLGIPSWPRGERACQGRAVITVSGWQAK